jgi:hypothetical protein
VVFIFPFHILSRQIWFVYRFLDPNFPTIDYTFATTDQLAMWSALQFMPKDGLLLPAPVTRKPALLTLDCALEKMIIPLHPNYHRVISFFISSSITDGIPFRSGLDILTFDSIFCVGNIKLSVWHLYQFWNIIQHSKKAAFLKISKFSLGFQRFALAGLRMWHNLYISRYYSQQPQWCIRLETTEWALLPVSDL